jgi:hypothetical protein
LIYKLGFWLIFISMIIKSNPVNWNPNKPCVQ